mmetsp:Transcript_6838/g.17216  ORF Transcript_6838/g.17216 Transcript_6838/m.17216 type:complete len:296 (+) Transcript_6838:1556-2443(+)
MSVPSPRPHSTNQASSKLHASTERGMTSPPSDSVVTTVNSGRRMMLMVSSVHRPTSATVAPPGKVARLIADTSLGSVHFAASRSPPAPSCSSSTSTPPPSATTACVAVEAARLIFSAGGGDQRARHLNVALSTSCTTLAVACRMAPPAQSPQCTDRSACTKPSSSTSSSSSSLMHSTRVSPTNDTTRYLSNALSPPAPVSAHSPLMPSSSTTACSLMPMLLRTIRRLPSLNAPEQVTSWPCPCRSRSTTQKSTIGPKFWNVCTTSTCDWAAGRFTRRTSCESPKQDPTNTNPLSK